MRRSRLAFVALAVFLSQCGSPKSQESDIKVVGGRLAKEYKFMAAVGGEDGQQFCGGSFIRSDVVVTAAHCVYQDHEKMWVSAGVQKLSDLNEDNRIPVEAVKIHPNYDPEHLHNDVALLFLDRKFIEDHRIEIESISFQNTGAFPESTEFSVIGWGNATSEGRYREDALQEAEVPMVTNEECRQSGGDYASIRNEQLCAGYLRDGGVDTCYGDSGGPLFLRQDRGNQLAGIVSWGEGCAEPGKPGVYTRVSSFAAWITHEMDRFDHLGEIKPRDIGELIRTFCYAGIDVRENAEGDGVWLDAYRNFTAGDDFVSTTFGSQKTAGPYCAFRLPSGREFEVFAAGVETRKPFFVVKSAGEAWEGNVEGKLGFLMSCDREGVASRVQFSQQEAYGTFLYNVQRFAFDDFPTRENLSSAREREKCQMHRTSYRYLTKNKAGDIRDFLEIKSPLLAGTLAFELFRMAPENEAQQKPSLGLELIQEDKTSGRLHVKNLSSKKIFGWQLSCNFSFSLTDLFGKAVPTRNRGDFFQVQYSAADKRNGILPIKSSLGFRFESEAPIDVNDPTKKCTLNGFPVRLNVQSPKGQKERFL